MSRDFGCPGEGAGLPADVQQVFMLVQVFRVCPHVVSQLQQTVREAFEDRVTAGGPAHGHQQRNWGEREELTSAQAPPTGQVKLTQPPL